MACTSGCPTPGEHANWGECMRAKNSRIGYANSANGWDYSKQKRFEAENAAYRQALRDGLEPQGVLMPQIRKAYEDAEKKG